MQLRLFTLCDLINALLQPYHDVLLRYDPLAGISSRGLLIATRFFFETYGSIGGAVGPENSLEGMPGWSALAKKQARQVMLRHSAAGAITVAGRRLWPAKSVKTLWVLHNVVVS
jgi:hypothetical protein